ncbi:MAG: alkaline phosphatase family protein [Bacillota bacterium]|jgi:hypothetical protein|nr:alkaline phosphatase family protein [Bacillota bacterium]HHU42794.1 PglZ domain-containing protein [Clostridiales bacterium]
MKRSFILSLILIVLIGVLSFSACQEKTEPLSITFIINGDIEEYAVVDIANFESVTFEDYDKTQLEGYRLSNIFDSIKTLSDQNWLMITSKDKISARIEYDSIHLVYIVIDEGKLNIKAPEHPRLVGVKDIKDITVISKKEIDSGLKIIDDDTLNISYGTVKLMLYEQTAENYSKGNVAYKHTPRDDVKVMDLTQKEQNIIYLDNKDIIKDKNDGFLVWEEGLLCYKKDNKLYKGVFGIVAGLDTVLFDAYYDMKDALKQDKVMFILVDGFSYQQAEYYHEDLQLLNTGYILVASVHPAISNVALASMLTGVSPYENGIVKREVKPPKVGDIFEYALSQGKKVKYIEGNSTLITTSIQPILNAPDIDGFTDANVFNSARTALEDELDLIFIHFHGIDDINHEYSPISTQAKAKILEIENYIIELKEAFNGTVIILSDHGSITYSDSDNKPKGKHGYFEKEDMIVPYYIFE